tara:strand:- start:4633 stop:4791 length:159 start_codon:yes stop_codon:yes gene_type:complete
MFAPSTIVRNKPNNEEIKPNPPTLINAIKSAALRNARQKIRKTSIIEFIFYS